MIKPFFTLFCLMALSLFGEEELSFSEIEVTTERVLDKQQNFFETSTNLHVAPRVNPITGVYHEESKDLVVAGAHPLSARRFYNSNAPYNPRTATWLYNPESYLVANFEWKKLDTFVSLGDREGNIVSLNRVDDDFFHFTLDNQEGASAFGPNGQQNPLNIHISYWRNGDPKNKHRFQYMGEVRDGTGCRKSFTSPMHAWTRKLRFTKKEHGWFSWGNYQKWRLLPTFWTPFQLFVTEERLPNGNIVEYTYTPWKKEPFDTPIPELLQSITAYNHDKSKILNKLEFEYPRTKHKEVAGIEVVGIDGRRASIRHVGKEPINLDSRTCPHAPKVSYTYDKRRLVKVTNPEGRVFTTTYNEEGKVAAQHAPVGPNGEMHPVATYRYNPTMTQVKDAEGHLVDYHFNIHKQLQAIAHLKNYRPYRIEDFEWDQEHGALKRKRIRDASGKTRLITEYSYDENHNPIEIKMGVGEEWRVIKNTFSKEGFNLLLTTSDREEKTTKYTYLPNTNLCTSELIYHNKAIVKRTFYTYDDCAILIKTIVDDGTTENPYDLTGVTTRNITTITPKQTHPCFGLPKIQEEKTIDAEGQEILLHKVIYTYTLFGKVLKEEHFDANNTYQYTIYNTYDNQERLIATQDPLGATTTFSYDANNNLIKTVGPRPDQCKITTYDLANRPIKIEEQIAPNQFITKEKKYNKLSQVIAEIDPFHNKTSLKYDVLGRVIAVLHPDGSQERREINVLGHVTKEIDAKGYETLKTYNPFGQVLLCRYPDGSEEHYTYNATGTVATHTDTNGNTTTFTYDIFDHPTLQETHSPKGDLLKVVSATWTPFHQLSETINGQTTTYCYDFAGRKVEEQKGYQKTRYSYDAMGRLCCKEQGDIQTHTTYDFVGNVLEEWQEHLGTVQTHVQYQYDEAGCQTALITSKGATLTTYDSLKRPLTITDPLGHVTTYRYLYGSHFSDEITSPNGVTTRTSYDANGRETLCCTKNPHGETIQSSESYYDSNGNLIALSHTLFQNTTPVSTLTHTWEYGPKNRLERFLEGGIKETLYHYDSTGKLQTIVKPNKATIHHEYDVLGRLAHFYGNHFDYTYTYDAQNRPTCIKDNLNNTQTTRCYDALDLITQETLGNALTINNTYDLQGRRTKQHLPNHSPITYAYKGAFLFAVSCNNHRFTYQERDLEGLCTTAISPLGEHHTQTDSLGRPLTIKTPYYTASNFTYGPDGNLLSYRCKDPLGEVEHHFKYDALDQLLEENDHTYQCDSLYNRTQKDDLSYEVTPLGEVTHDGQTAYTYDACGNLLSDDKSTYTYDALDRLIAVEQENLKVHYTYDSFHRRLSKTKHTQQGSTTTRYLWDGNLEIGAIDEENTLLEFRVLGEGLGAEVGAALFIELDGDTYLPLHDHRGCLVALVDLNTHTPTCIRYTAFGEEAPSSCPSPWRFSSKRLDEETSLIYFGRRYYHRGLGRFITQDPNGFDDGPNLYAYLKNSPLVHIDPYGLMSILSVPTIDMMSWGQSVFAWVADTFMHTPGEFYDFEAPFANKSRPFDLNKDFDQNFPEPEIGACFFCNGVGNKFEDLKEKSLLISLLSGFNTKGVYNATHGLHNDGKEALMNMMGVMTNPGYILFDKLSTFLNNTPSWVCALLIAHSQGTADGETALEHLPKELRDRVVVAAFCPSSYISKNLCKKVTHYVCRLDPVPYADSKGRKECADTIVKVKWKFSRKHSCHEFMHPIYLKHLRDEIQSYQKMLKDNRK